MLRSDYKYSRKPSIESATEDKPSVNDFVNTAEPASSSTSRRSSSMKHWSPLAALGKRARDGLRRCNTVRAGLGLGGGGSGGGGGADGSGKGVSKVGSSTQNAEGLSGADRGRRNAMSNIFLGLPSSGVRRLFAVYGIDDTGGAGFRGRTAKSASGSPISVGRGGASEESLFAKHTRTSSMRRPRLPSYAVGGTAGVMQYQQALMQQQQHQLLQQQQMLLPHYYNPQHGHLLDRRRASSMRDHKHSRHEVYASSYEN